MKKLTQHRSKQYLNGTEQLQHTKLQQKMVKAPSKQFNHSSKVRYLQSHPFSQRDKQLYGFSRIYNRHNTESHCEVYPKDYSQSYRKKVGRSSIATAENIILLQQRLKNIREHYQTIITEEKSKNSQRSEVIMGLILQMQTTHNEKMDAIRKAIQDNEQERKDVGFVDDKMNEIKGNIDDLINQSNNLKLQNQQLQKHISQKARENEQKQNELEELNREVLEARTQLQQFELANLKNNKINKQIIEIFNSASTFTSI